MKLMNLSRIVPLILLLGAALTLALPGLVRGHVNSTYTFVQSHGSVKGQQEQSKFVPPSLSILEAADLPGYMVTIQGNIAEESSQRMNTPGTVYLKDETGGIHLVMDKEPFLKQGDRIRATGKIVYKQGKIEIHPAAGGIQRLQ